MCQKFYNVSLSIVVSSLGYFKYTTKGLAQYKEGFK